MENLTKKRNKLSVILSHDTIKNIVFVFGTFFSFFVMLPLLGIIVSKTTIFTPYNLIVGIIAFAILGIVYLIKRSFKFLVLSSTILVALPLTGFLFGTWLKSFLENNYVTYLFVGTMAIVVFAIVQAIYVIIDESIKKITCLINLVRVSFILQYLPVSEDDIKNINVSSYTDFETILLKLFKNMPKTLDDCTKRMITESLYKSILAYVKTDMLFLMNDKSFKTEEDLKSFIKIFISNRSEELLNYFITNKDLIVLDKSIHNSYLTYLVKNV